MLTLEFYLIFLAALFVGYFLNTYSDSNYVIILVFIASLMAFWLSVFYPVQMFNGWETTIIDPLTTNVKPILKELTLITNIFRITFLTSVIVSVMIWTVGKQMDKKID